MPKSKGDYADVTVLQRRRIRVAFNGKVTEAEAKVAVLTHEIYDITDEETLETLAVEEVHFA